ncbi:hypothetical protein F2Q70_00036476 [Brassica cretica]|uniref:Uncharacterized protein n=1 Tax=Brassica cretica TaxID=69181 RepID=A0A3N6S0G2_BRACR|nr:hypothetical protein F2Q70_00036476 [Brassica cretica]KAF3530122.1 hypothetical protein DY000_02041506 [Brassica cretica]
MKTTRYGTVRSQRCFKHRCDFRKRKKALRSFTVLATRSRPTKIEAVSFVRGDRGYDQRQ